MTYELTEKERAAGLLRPLRRAYMHSACMSVTSPNEEVSLEMAKEPLKYSTTYCVRCGMYRPMSEFKWVEDGKEVGT